MLMMKKAESYELPAVELILKEYNMQIPNEIQKDVEYTIAYDNQSIIAVSGITYYQKYGILRSVVVKKDYQKQGIGDGIIRAVLNAADHKGMGWVFADKKCDPRFLEKIGFQRIDEGEISRILGVPNVEQLDLGVKLPDFFLKACKAKKRG